MLFRITIILSYILLFSTNCKKEKLDIPIYFPGSTEYGEASAKKAGQDWSASAFGQLHSGNSEYFGVTFVTFSEDGFLRETIYLNEIPIRTGVFEVKRTIAGIYDGFVGSNYGTSLDDGDVADDYYYLDEEIDDNILEVTFIDTITMMARGTFNLNFVRSENDQNPNPINPEKVEFSEGTFEVQIIE